MHDAGDILSLFETRMRELDMTQTELGHRAFGKADNTAIQSLKKGSSPAYDRVAAMAKVLGLELYLGLPREGTPVQTVENVTIDGADFSRVPLHDAYLSAGPGAENGDDVAIIDQLVFRQDWLRKVGVNPENAAMARISGDSMAPGIQSGDLVMIDKTRIDVPLRKPSRKPNQLPIFAFMQDDQARVKRLERLVKEKLLILYSDNKDMPPEIIGESNFNSLNILGQVIWSGHVWR